MASKFYSWSNFLKLLNSFETKNEAYPFFKIKPIDLQKNSSIVLIFSYFIIVYVYGLLATAKKAKLTHQRFNHE